MSSSLNGRVLHVGKFYPPFRGGMETYLADLIEEQRKQGLYAIGLVHGQPQADDPSWLHRVPVQAQILYAPLGISFPFTLRRLIRQFEPDVLHLHMPNNAVFWALLMPLARKLPWVVHWHSDVVRSSIRRLISIVYGLVYEPFERAVLRQADRIIVTSPSYLDASKPLASWRDKVAVVPLGLTPRASAQAPAHGADADDSPDWQPGALRLLSLGRLTYYKGFETLIQAVSGMDRVQLLIAGAGDMHAHLNHLIQQCTPPGHGPAIRLLGAVTEEHKHRLLASCDVFCLASRERTEAFGLAVLEAMQHGKPCIVSDLRGSGLPWIVRQSGNGLLAEVDKPESWRTTIARLQHDPAGRTQLGQAGLKAAATLFSIEASARKIVRLYANVAPEVFFKAPKRSRLHLILAHTQQSAILVGPMLSALKQAGCRSFLLLGSKSTQTTLHALAAQHDDVTIIAPALHLSTWNTIQAGIRFALRHGYQNALTLYASTDSNARAALELLRADQVTPASDLQIGIHSEVGQSGRADGGLLDRWAVHLTGVRLQGLESRLRLYRHDAMVIAASREATLLDHDDVGSLLLMKKSRLQVTEVPVPSAPTRQHTLRHTVASFAALALFWFSSWSIRRGSTPR